MVNALVLFGVPLDREAFDTYVDERHHPMLLGLPNVEEVATHRIAGAALGEALFHLIVDLRFSSEEAMQEGLNSEEGRAVASDLVNFASGGVTILCSNASSNRSSETD
jgi:uncharacterized protein (TIGR02118 family)